MRTNWIGVVLGLGVQLLGITVWGAMQAPDFSISASMRSSSKLEVVALPPAKHHFNVYAPMDLEDTEKNWHWRPVTIKEDRVIFVALRGNGQRNFLVSLYLCDDGNTYCEKHKLTFKWPEQTAAKAAPVKVAAVSTPKPTAAPVATPTVAPTPLPTAVPTTVPTVAPTTVPPTPTPEPEKPVTLDRHGFIDNNADAAFQRAMKKKLPVILSFYAIWCPPCNLLDGEVFGSAEFQRVTKKSVKVKLDADAESSWTMKSKYKVGSYPTLVVASESGEELYRIVGYRPKAEYAAELRSALTGSAEELAKLQSKADAGDAASALQAGKVLLARENFQGAAALFSKAQEKEPSARQLLTEAEIGQAEKNLAVAASGNEQGPRDALIQRIEKALVDFPSIPSAIEWRHRAADLYEQAGKPEHRAKHLLAIVVLAEQLGLDPKNLKGTSMLLTDLWQEAAWASEASGNDVMAKHFWKRAAMELGRMKASRRAGERGYSLDRAYCLWKSGDVTTADNLYRSLESQYPKEFTFFYAHARMKQELKNFDEASTLVAKALKFSYGDNKLRAAKLAGELSLDLGKASDGLTLVREALASAKVPEDTGLRTHRYVKQLREVEAKLAAAAK